MIARFLSDGLGCINAVETDRDYCDVVGSSALVRKIDELKLRDHTLIIY